MSVVITTYTLASGLMQQGMTWAQAMLTILLGNSHRAGADDAQRARRHEVPASFPVLCRAALRRHGRQRAGAAARVRRLRLVRHPDLDWRAALHHADAARRCPRLASACPATCGSRFARFWVVQVAIIVRGLEGIKCARELVGAAARSAAARCCSGLGEQPRRRPLGTSVSTRIVAPAEGARAVLAALPGGADGQRRLLGDAQPQHPGLHALRAQPAVAGAGPGARAAGDDDGVRVHRRGGHERDDRDSTARRSGIRCS